MGWGLDVNIRNSPTTIVQRIARLNSNWWEESTSEAQNRNFVRAMALAKEEYLYTLRDVYMRLIMCYAIVKDVVEKRTDFHASGRIIHFEKHCAWKEALFKVEKNLKIEGQVIFAIYKNISGESYRVSTVPVEPGSFNFRLGLSEEWRGKSMKELQETSGIEDMVFCHHSGFIGGAVSLESAIKMAEISLKKLEETEKKE
jgi:uncharacterized UPF0160 family protein